MGPDATDPVATLHWTGDSYAIEAIGQRHVWVNGHRIDAVQLMHGDMIEFEEHGPMSRFRLSNVNSAGTAASILEMHFPTRGAVAALCVVA